MQHLDTDRLAALADEAPTDAEASHLASCVVCRRERDAFVALLALAQREGSAALGADLPASGPPLTSWESLAGTLRAEGLVRPATERPAPATSAGATTVRALPTARASLFLRRAAASIALIVGGGAVGRLTAPRAVATVAPTPAAATAPPVAAVPTPSATMLPAPRPDSAARPASRGVSDTLPVFGEAEGQLASSRGDAGGFTGVPDALQTLAHAQREYQRAATYLAEHDTGTVSGTPQILRARLAALDEVMPKVREALYEAPQDPVLNQYYLTTADVRESTLRQLGRALPTGQRLNGY